MAAYLQERKDQEQQKDTRAQRKAERSLLSLPFPPSLRPSCFSSPFYLVLFSFYIILFIQASGTEGPPCKGREEILEEEAKEEDGEEGGREEEEEEEGEEA